MASKVIKKILLASTVLVLGIFLVFAIVKIVQTLVGRKEFESIIVNLFKSKIDNSNTAKKSCLKCHLVETRFEFYHNPKVIGCTSCHLGNPDASEKEIAHKDLILFPGNLDVVDRTCGRSECHYEIASRVKNSLMNTMSGVVSVDKYVFGEIGKPIGKFQIEQIGFSPADVHLRNLCASCHLGKAKKEYAKIQANTRGGGCSACHLYYDSLTNEELNRFVSGKNFVPRYHPNVSLKVEPIACFGCHSRSGRISTNFIGLMETTLDEIPTSDSAKFVKLEDGRVFVKVPSDVHHSKGMTCVDCHTSREIMGDGNVYEHKEQQVEIACVDCHPEGKPKTVAFDSLDNETKMIINLRGWQSFINKQFVKIGKNGNGYSNVIAENGKILVFSKLSNKIWEARPQSATCLQQRKLHPTIDCNVCHTQWVPRCVSCHTYYEPNEFGWDNLSDTLIKGCWKEIGGDFFASKATLGNVVDDGKMQIKTFMPGMILTIDGTEFPNKSFEKKERLFAPTFSHTITKSVPSCKECHLNPLVYGFGDGVFQLEPNGNKKKMIFRPTFPIDTISKLPKDAWIDFSNPRIGKSTRVNAYSLTKLQIKTMQGVGSCFLCHQWEKEKILEIFSNNYRKKVTKKCFLLK
ncbi:hypothetical protein D9V84_01495 [Bacteroidetes/Chlorobi group bacterium Naka2016]|jgi:hypothetical protein|nr:MAG: hypothetical protein D9V84_01495 [Bacteroidetes/Chlorobi group bacterium Naka2016]